MLDLGGACEQAEATLRWTGAAQRRDHAKGDVGLRPASTRVLGPTDLLKERPPVD
jgi:hypothetical protein